MGYDAPLPFVPIVVGVGCGLGGGPLRYGPSPWDPLLISPWEGEGNGSRERGHVVGCWGTSATGVGWGVVGAVREPPLRVGEGRGRVVAVGGVAVNFGHPPARCARVPLRFAKGGKWRALFFAGFPRPRE